MAVLSMKIDLEKIENNTTFKYSFEDAWLKELAENISKQDDTFDLISPLDLKFTITKPCAQKDTFFIDEHLKANLKTTCNKCLCEFTYALDENSFFTLINKPDHTLQEKSQNTADIDIEMANTSDDFEDDENTIFISDSMLDLNHFINESIYLNLPYSFICKDDCSGLCPQCGINLNIKKCDCSKEVRADHPFAVLKKINSDGGKNGCTKEENIKNEKR